MSLMSQWPKIVLVAVITVATGSLAFSQDQDRPESVPGELQDQGYVRQAPAAAEAAKDKVYVFEYGAVDQQQQSMILIASVGGGQYKGFDVKLQNERFYQHPGIPNWRGWMYDVNLGGKTR